MATGVPAATKQGQAPEKPKPDTSRKDLGPGSLDGNLTEDPVLRYTPSGKAVCSLRIAVSERKFNEHTKAWEDTPAEFFTVTCWPPLAERCAEYLARGQRVVAEGRWESQSWEDKEGTIQERVTFVASDLGPSMKWAGARIVDDRKKGS